MVNMKNTIHEAKRNRKSGLVVAIVAIPLSLSLAIASGGTPLQWIISAIWGMVLAAIFASNKYNIFGPAGALSAILLGFSLIYGGVYLPFIAIVSWGLMLIAYRTKIIKYLTLIPVAWLEWFLFAVWLTILVSQLPNALWIVIPMHDSIYLNIKEVFLHITETQFLPIITTIVSVVFIMVLKKKTPKIPGTILVSLIGIGIWFLIQKGILPHMNLLIDSYPTLNFSLRNFDYIHGAWKIFQNNDMFFTIIKTSVIIAVLSILETIISGKAAEKLTKKPFSKDKEILWNAIANIWSGMMWWLPVTAVFVRTSLNIKSGAESKRSAGIAGIGVMLICLLTFNNLFTLLPMSIIAAILISIAISIIDFKVLKNFYTFKKTSFSIIIITIIVSIFVDTVSGILVGTLIALLVFIKRTTNEQLNIIVFNQKKFVIKTTLVKYIKKQKADDTIILKFSWQVNYLNCENYYQQLLKIKSCKNIIFSFSQVSDFDMDGLESLESSIHYFKAKHINVYLTGVGSKRMKKMSDNIPVIKKKIAENKLYASTSELLDNIQR